MVPDDKKNGGERKWTGDPGLGSTTDGRRRWLRSSIWRHDMDKDSDDEAMEEVIDNEASDIASER